MEGAETWAAAQEHLDITSIEDLEIGTRIRYHWGLTGWCDGEIDEYIGEAEDNEEADNETQMGYLYLVSFSDDVQTQVELTLDSYCIDREGTEGHWHFHDNDDDDDDDDGGDGAYEEGCGD